jgi:general secretion pathway protein E
MSDDAFDMPDAAKAALGPERLAEIGDDDVDPAMLEMVSLSFVKKNMVLPLKKTDGTLRVAMADFDGIFALGEIGRITGLPVSAVLVEKSRILEAINRFYDRLSGSAAEVIEGMSAESLDALVTEWEEPKDLIDLSDEAPIINLLNSLIFQAVKDRASDIHIEPYEKEVEVRFRVDGVLYHVLSPPKTLQEALCSRVKIMAGLDIAEKRLPQDGKIRLLVAGKDIYVRVSIIPTSFGERIVLRILDTRAGIIGLGALGLSGAQVKDLEALLLRSNGIILSTGPTGSGKTTTLYAALNKINFTDRNIITIEDPVEYQLKGVGQIHVDTKVGLSFASGLRSILRQDPDVIMVGEIRDREAADIAIQASLTGHLVLSTLHTTDTATAITRLVEMGVEPYLVASSLSAVLAQRLVRVLCTHCKVPYKPGAQESALFPFPQPKELFKPGGCEKCFKTGYHGRIGIFEFLIFDEESHSVLLKRQDADHIKKYFISRGMQTMLENGLHKAASGMTSLAEVMRVITDKGA